ncbi:MAG: aminoglycoside phosphotransferase family protein [Oscillospiraceae bacterium]|nr:aminoglycoside phosphotransferase family protein [Oscillospiraceae bacterium]
MKNFFTEAMINGDIWYRLRQSKENFIPLIKYIYETNKLKFNEASVNHEPPYAVFRVENTIVKIFNPPEAKFWNEPEYDTELKAMKFCKNLGVLTPDIICNGIVYDSIYSFPYIVMNYIDGVDAEKAMPAFNHAEKVEFALKLKELKNKISCAAGIEIMRCDDPDRINHNLWNHMPEPFKEERKRYIANANFSEFVFNHGDLNDSNIIIDKQGRLNLIDFAESVIAPSCYDWGSILYCLGYEPVMMDVFFGDYKNDSFYEMLTASYILHFWGGVHIGEIANDIGIDIAGITSINALKNMLIKWLDIKMYR